MRDKNLTAVVLAAGEGQRLGPLTNRRPKPMLPVVGRPLLEHVVEAVAAAGINDIVLVVGYKRDRIQTHFGDGDDWDVSIDYAIQENQLGTAHAVKQARPYVDDRFLVLNGDRIIEPSIVTDVRDTIAGVSDQTVPEDDLRSATEPIAAMGVTRVVDAGAFGVVTLSGDQVVNVVEKPREESLSEIINAGVYGFTPAVFEVIDEIDPARDGEYWLTAAVDRLAERGPAQAVRYDGWWLDVSYPWDLLSVTGQVLDRHGGGAHGTIGTGGQVDTAAYVAESATVGRNTIIGRGSAIGDNARVGPNATLERTLVFPDATVDAGAVVRDCIVGANASIGPNVTIADGDATVLIDGEAHDDVDFGGAIGDNAQVGGAAVLKPGSIVGDGAVVGEGAIARGRVPDGVELRRG